MNETELRTQILEYLTYHPSVAFVRRYNSAYLHIKTGGKSRWMHTVKAAKGVEFTQLDIMGMLKDGRLFAVEIKAPGKKPQKRDKGQLDEIRFINDNGGLAFWSNSLEMVKEQMANAMLEVPSNDSE